MGKNNTPIFIRNILKAFLKILKKRNFLNVLEKPFFASWNQNPREAGREYSYFHLYMCVCIHVCHASWPNDDRYRPDIWYTHSPGPHLKTGFCFFEKATLKAASLEKLPCHVDFSHISSIVLFDILPIK